MKQLKVVDILMRLVCVPLDMGLSSELAAEYRRSDKMGMSIVDAWEKALAVLSKANGFGLPEHMRTEKTGVNRHLIEKVASFGKDRYTLPILSCLAYLSFKRA